MKFTAQVLSLMLSVMFLAGCAARMPPRATSPEEFFSVTVNSIPSGAFVYEVDANDGSLGKLLGKTPYDLRLGLAVRRHSNGNLDLFVDGVKLWGDGVNWSSYRKDNNQHIIELNVAVAKDGFYTSKVTKKRVATIDHEHRYPPLSTTVTVALRPVVESTRAAPQQQQQQQQQTIIIPDTGGNKNSYNDCVQECKKMYLKGELKQDSTIEECIKLLCM